MQARDTSKRILSRAGIICRRTRPLRGLSVAALLALALLLAPALWAQTPNDALFNAVELNDIDAVQAAIKAGADLGAKNARGMTPADVAVDLGHFRIAHALLAYRNGGSQTAPRVTEKAKDALTEPRARAAPKAMAQPATNATQAAPAPDPRLAELMPPRKPRDVPKPPDDAVPSAPAAEIDSAAEPRPADSETAEKAAPPPPTVPVKEPSNFFGSVLSGLKNVVTLGGLIGGDDTPPATEPNVASSQPERTLTNPADRFSSGSAARPPAEAPAAPESEPQPESAAGRMVDRLRDTVGGKTETENAFGLPDNAVPPPETEPGAPPGLIAPVEPRVATPVEPPSTVPGIAELAEPAPTPAPAARQSKQPPPDQGLDIPGLPPGLGAPAEPTPPAAAAPTPRPSLAEEVPGIIPLPAPAGRAAQALPPGLEPLPGSNRLRRPGGLIVPGDPNDLPPPGSVAEGGTGNERLQRIDEILNRAPVEERNRFRPTVGTGSAAPKPGEVPASSPSRPVDPAPPGGMTAGANEVPPGSQVRDTEAILRGARESETLRAEQTNRDGRLQVRTAPPVAPNARIAGHALQPPSDGVTARGEPTTRMIDRLSSLTDRPYQNDDIYGLPVAKPSADGTLPPRKDVDVAKVPDPREEKANGALYALARFFRGDQEEESGMLPPPDTVSAEALPPVIDNLVPENDPARGRVVDDRMLDLTGVERMPQTVNDQLGSAPTRDARLNPNFVDKLNNVLGPGARTSVPAPTVPTEPGKIGLDDLNVPTDQIVPAPKPSLPDPWTMTIERSDAEGGSRTLGVTAISPEDGSELRTEKGVVSQMVGRIRSLLGGKGPADADDAPNVDTLDAADRQSAAEKLLSDALRDGTPTALPDQNQWPVTEIEALDSVPGVPPAPRPGVLTRTSLTDVILSLGESVTLENTLPPQQEGIDPLNECIKKNRGSTLFCVEPVDWPESLRPAFVVPTILYTGPMAITRYDQGIPSRFHALFESEQFEDVVAYYQARFGEPTEIWKRSIAPLAKPRMDNPTVSWRSRDSRSNVITVLEIRKFDDSRGGFPDINRGAVMLYHFNAPSIFPQVSSHELMRLRRAIR